MAHRKTHKKITSFFENKDHSDFENKNQSDYVPEPIIRYSVDDFFVDTVKKDYNQLIKRVHLATTPRVEELHFMHSVYGHACSGHREFHTVIDRKNVPVMYKNITIEDVVKNLPDQNTHLVKSDRQEVINNISGWLYDRIDTLKNPGYVPKPEDIRLINVSKSTNGPTIVEPLAGSLMFNYAILKDFESVLIGYYLGSCMDSDKWREKVDAKFGTTMHKGTCVPMDLYALKKNNLLIDDFQNSEYLTKLPQLENLNSNDKIKSLMNLGIVPKHNPISSTSQYSPAFVELSKGYGISDDAAFITTSLLFGIEAGFGLLLADAVDTFDKYSSIIEFGGQDESIGKKLKQKYETTLNKPFPVSDDQIIDMIYLASMNAECYNNFPSCSQRRFWQEDENGMTAVQSHMSFLNYLKNDSKYPPQTKIGFSGIFNKNFYTAYINKLEEALKDGIITGDSINLNSLTKKKHHFNSNHD
jgi:hypothetical protein